MVPPMRGLFFDFDGVVADTEWISNTLLAETVSGLGVPTTVEQALELYVGNSWPHVQTLIEEAVGRKLAPDFVEGLERQLLERYTQDLTEVAGVSTFLERFVHLPRCVASGSAPDVLAHALRVIKLADKFGEHVYSARMVARGKPHPDVYLYAAEKIGVSPANGIAIEDSGTGVRSGVAAGMTVIGLCAGKHIRPGHDARLRDAGAHHICHSWAEAAGIVDSLI